MSSPLPPQLNQCPHDQSALSTILERELEVRNRAMLLQWVHIVSLLLDYFTSKLEPYSS